MKIRLRKLFTILMVFVMLFSNTSVAFAAPGGGWWPQSESDVYDHIDVRMQGTAITMKYVTKNLVTGEVVSTENVTINCTVTGITSVSYTELKGTDDEKSWTWTSGFSNSGGNYEFRKMNLSLSKDLSGSYAVIVVDLTDSNGNVYEDVTFTFGPSGCQQALYDCDGYSSTGSFGSVGLDFILGVNNDATIVYTDWVIPATKKWNDGGDQDGIRPDSVQVQLYANGSPVEGAVATLNEANGWSYKFEDMESVDSSGNEITYTIQEVEVPEGYTASVDNNSFTVTNTHEPYVTSVTASKLWEDNDNSLNLRPTEIYVQLYGNSAACGEPVALNEANGWSYTWEGLDLNSGGEPITYTVDEVEVPEGYEKSVDGLVITNTFAGDEDFTDIFGSTYITGQKIWDDNENSGGVRPDSITVHLLADGVKVASQTVTGPDWTWSFDLSKGVPGTGENPVGVKFTVTEDAIEHYTLVDTVNPSVEFNYPTAEEDWTTIRPCSSLNISNTQDNKTIVIAKKGNTYVCWTADPLAAYERDLIVASYAAATNSSEDSSRYSFISGMGISSDFGMTVNETEIIFGNTSFWSWLAYGSYNRGSSSSTGSSLTNKVDPTTVTITKEWNDNDDQDGVRPDSITVYLLANGQQVDSATVTADDGWKASFEDLPKFLDGEEIEYSAAEDEVPQYTAKIDGLYIVNSHAPEQTSVTVTKEWDDNDDQDGIRPSDITVVLLADGEKTDRTLVLNEGNSWTGSFTELDKFAAGVEIAYTVEEIDVRGYDSTVAGSMRNGFTVTNVHTPETTSVSGTKTWIDNENQDGVRPDSITINLLADGEVIDTRTVTANDNWSWNFTDLPKFKDQGTAIEYAITEEAVEEYSTTYDGYNVTNTHTPEELSVTVTKAWDDSNNQDGVRPNDITVILLADGEKTGRSLVLSEGNSWTGSFTELDKFAAGEEIVYSIEEIKVDAYETTITGDMKTGFSVTNKHTAETVEVEGTKTWVDNDDQDGKRPDSITIRLLADGEVIDTRTVTANDNWSWSFTELPKHKGHGTVIEYSVTEDAVEEYSTAYNGYNVTNTHTPEEVSVTVSKQWLDKDDQDGIRPNDITVILLADGEATENTLILNSGNNWTGSFTGLDKFSAGEEIVYSIEELKVEGYESVITGDMKAGFSIANSHTPETVDVEGSKTWVDNDDQDGKRPESITINLLADGEVIDTRSVTAEDGWAWSFTDLPKFKDQGTAIEYSVTEEAVEEYSTSYSGYNVTNTHTPEEVSVTVTKAWQDSNDQDGVRPNDVTVILLADGEDTGLSLVLSEGNNWTGSFTELDKFADGTEIAYSIEELKVNLYETVITGSQTAGYTVTNSHTPETVNVEGAKTWVDNDDQDGKRPESITIDLHADGEVIDTRTVTAEDGWAWSFTNLPKFKNQGVAINYSITEQSVEEYSTSYNGYNVTNTHTPEEVSVTVSKAWVDSDDQDGIRPNDITVILLADGERTERSLVLSEGNNWTGSFTELDKFAAGAEIVYSIEELAVDGYETVITGDMKTGFTVTNSHTPETVEVEGSKTWEDNDDQDGKRPESITINLLADGEVIDTAEVTAEDGWAWSFTNLPKFKDHGTAIEYSITEEAVEEYSTAYNGYNVTNTHTPEEVSVTVTKAWADNDDQDGIRPNDITVILLADGEDTGRSLILSEGNNWTASFTELDKYAAGTEIAYSVAEPEIAGYTAVISGDMSTGFTITNSHTPETTEIIGTKTWVDNDDQDGVRPEAITINLMKNGEVLESISVTEAEGWAWAFSDLPVYEDHGTEINYSITENAVEDYSAEYDGYNVTNTHTPEQTSVSVVKAWQDSGDQDGIRPEDITVVLLADGVVTDKTLKLSAENNWTGSFTELDKFAAGVEISYSIEELAVEGYETVITGDMSTGFTVTNSHTPETVKVEGSKTWDDSDNQDGARPESITIKLMKNGEVHESISVTEAEGWAWSFDNLPKYENGGTEIVYAITEDAVEGYSTSYEGYNVINSYTPEEVSITVTKAWADSDDQDGLRPDEIAIVLYADGKLVKKSLVLTAEDKWSGSFVGLPKYKDGKEIEYTVGEVAVKGYNTVIRGDAESGFVVTNSRTVIPHTGDERDQSLWAMLMLGSMCAVAYVLKSSKEKKEDEI